MIFSLQGSQFTALYNFDSFVINLKGTSFSLVPFLRLGITCDSMSKKQESPLVNIMVNVLLPVLALSYLSKDPVLDNIEAKPWHLGPMKALMVALALPLGYGIWHFLKTKKFNLFSGVGVLSVVLTGAVTLYLWNEDGSVKPDAAFWFGAKEAIQPIILGVAFLLSSKTKSPLFSEFVYNDAIFDLQRIQKSVAEQGKKAEHEEIIRKNTLIFCSSFVISAILNFCLAFYFLGDLDFSAVNARELYNSGVAKITGWGFAVIGLPLLVFAGFVFFKLIREVEALTGLSREEVILAR